MGDFILFALRLYEQKLVERGAGSTFEAISRDDLESLEIPLPPLRVQQRIAALLTEQIAAVERARAGVEAQVAEASKLPSAYLLEAYDGKERRDWPIQRLGDIAQVGGGIQKSPDRSPSTFHCPYLTVRNVHRGWLDLSEVGRFEVSPEELERCRLQNGDILVVEGNGSLDHIGRNAIFRGEIEDCIHQNHLIRVRPNQTVISPEFLSRYLNSPMGQAQMIAQSITTTGLNTLSVSKVENLTVPVPNPVDQERTLSALNTRLPHAQRVYAALEAQLAQINNMPTALLARAFSGGH